MKAKTTAIWAAGGIFIGATAASAVPIHVTHLWHMHQPIYYPYESVRNTDANSRYNFNVEGNVWDEDYDPEWDVDYDYDRFEWVRTGFRTAEAATDSYDGANPGGGTEMPYKGNAARAKKLDKMAAALKSARR